MKYKVKIAILSFFILFLSTLNLKNGLVFSVTDNTERDAFFTSFEEKTDKKDSVKSDLKTVNIPKTKTTATVAKKTTTKTSAKNSITVGGRTLTIVNGTVAKNKLQTPANTVAKYQKMIYGHNTASVFGNLKNLKKGSIFTVTINGKTTKYQVVGKEGKNDGMTVEKASSNASLFYNATYKKYLYGNYDLTLMTCDGTDLGNGKATHRLVIFAKKV